MNRSAYPAMLLGLLAGCSPTATPNAPPAAGPGPSPTSPAPAAEIMLKTVKFAGLDQFLQGQRGRVVVLDVWADW